MNDENPTSEMSLPLDSEGFLRRECPTCEREFKWLHTPDDEIETKPQSQVSYFCPYCRVNAEAGAWYTKAQLELARSTLMAEVVDPMLHEFANDIENIGRSSRGMISAEVSFQSPEKPQGLTEVDDMKRVEFSCHPSEPLKILEDWDRPVRCLICGSPTS